jgi:hypothetical protein
VAYKNATEFNNENNPQQEYYQNVQEHLMQKTNGECRNLMQPNGNIYMCDLHLPNNQHNLQQENEMYRENKSPKFHNQPQRGTSDPPRLNKQRLLSKDPQLQQMLKNPSRRLIEKRPEKGVEFFDPDGNAITLIYCEKRGWSVFLNTQIIVTGGKLVLSKEDEIEVSDLKDGKVVFPNWKIAEKFREYAIKEIKTIHRNEKASHFIQPNGNINACDLMIPRIHPTADHH